MGINEINPLNISKRGGEDDEPEQILTKKRATIHFTKSIMEKKEEKVK